MGVKWSSTSMPSRRTSGLVTFFGAYLAPRFLVRYLSDPKRTLTPFAIYCIVAGLGSAIYLSVR